MISKGFYVLNLALLVKMGSNIQILSTCDQAGGQDAHDDPPHPASHEGIMERRPSGGPQLHDRMAQHQPRHRLKMMTTNQAKDQTQPDTQGRKADMGKPRMSLLPWRAVGQIVQVLEFGATKYEPDNWQLVPNARQRYFDAAMRHLLAWWNGERLDAESGLHHLAHAGCCVLFLLWADDKPVQRENDATGAELLAQRVKALVAAQEARYAGR